MRFFRFLLPLLPRERKDATDEDEEGEGERKTRKLARTHPLHNSHLQNHPSQSQSSLHLLEGLFLLFLLLFLFLSLVRDRVVVGVDVGGIEELKGGDVAERDDNLMVGVVEEETYGGRGAKSESELVVGKRRRREGGEDGRRSRSATCSWTFSPLLPTPSPSPPSRPPTSTRSRSGIKTHLQSTSRLRSLPEKSLGKSRDGLVRGGSVLFELNTKRGQLLSMRLFSRLSVLSLHSVLLPSFPR